MRDAYEEQWVKKFIELNNRKPSHNEKLAFRVGFNTGVHYKEIMESKIEEEK